MKGKISGAICQVLFLDEYITSLQIGHPLEYYYNVPNDKTVSAELGKKIFSYADLVMQSKTAKPIMQGFVNTLIVVKRVYSLSFYLKTACLIKSQRHRNSRFLVRCFMYWA